MWKYIAFVMLLPLLRLSLSQQRPDEDGPGLCYSLQGENYTCAKCIEFHKTCAWCSVNNTKFNNAPIRCDTKERLIANGCPENQIEDPRSKVTIVRNESLSSVKNKDNPTENVDIVQLTPQEVHIKIRPKDTVVFNIDLKQAKDYPVDLYYLMDLSYSMSDDKDQLSKLGIDLAARMKVISDNFQLGFGSFVDKKVMPFVDPRVEKANRPCDSCVEPYGFKHQMSLTQNTERFSYEVNASRVSGNLDAPEGSFDAIIQALSCNEQIGWRPKARRMLVVSTDAGFHYAGDGRLGGLVVPNDGECHLDNGNYYSKSTEFDYPSVGQIHKRIRDSQANVIFAVTEEQVPLYQRLLSALPDISSSVGTLANDSRNIVTLIERAYQNISEKVIIIDNVNVSDGLNITYFSKCKDGNYTQRSSCDNISVGDSISFTVALRLEQCTSQKNFNIIIQRSGLDETVNVNIEVLCDCDCSKEDQVEYFSKSCNEKGNLVCGICQCPPPFFGHYCECNSTALGFVSDLLCRENGDINKPVCGGRGQCSCNKCNCYSRPNSAGEHFYGNYCQCDNFNCPRRNRLLCSGHGTCDCGNCICFPGWEGVACECPKGNDTCIAPNQKRLCNGQGYCFCGKCTCKKDKPYHGAFCELCSTCPKKCEEHRPCVLCRAWQHGPYNKTTCDKCPHTYLPVDDHKEYGLDQTYFDCQYQDLADDCTFYFRYAFNETLDGLSNDSYTVWYRRGKDCPPPIPILAIVLGVIAGIVLIGLVLLLLWKLLTIIHDRREYAKFEKERLMARWDTGENPIFHPATTTFKNPAYGGK